MRTGAAQLLGWIGVATILGAYALVSFEQIGSDTVLYQALNIVGSVLIIIETANKKDYQPMALNIVWALIAIIALAR